jgi:ABC-type Fe3+ transport system permease subunit
VKAKNFAGAVALAVGVALPFAVPTFAHIGTWKIVLGIAGLILFMRAGMGKT